MKRDELLIATAALMGFEFPNRDWRRASLCRWRWRCQQRNLIVILYPWSEQRPELAELGFDPRVLRGWALLAQDGIEAASFATVLSLFSLDRLHACWLLLPRSGLERNHFVRWPD